MTTDDTTTATTATTTATSATGLSQERADLLESLRAQRGFLLHAVRGLSEEQARRQSTVSTLTLGGLVKHVTAVEAQWADFVVNGPAPVPQVDWASIDWSDPPAFVQEFTDGFRMLEHETLAGLVAAYEEQAARTDALVAEVDLDHSHPLPEAPWFEPGGRRSARRAFTHVVGETAQHSGHADIIREAIDGQQTMSTAALG